MLRDMGIGNCFKEQSMIGSTEKSGERKRKIICGAAQ